MSEDEKKEIKRLNAMIEGYSYTGDVAGAALANRRKDAILTSARIAELESALKVALEALSQYADPTFYHAILIVPDPPTGGFDQDVSMTDEYDYPKPGKLARETLAALTERKTE